MKTKIEHTSLVLYDIFNKYHNFVDIIWDNKKQNNLTDYYEAFKNELFIKTPIAYDDINAENMKHIYNTCLYIQKNILPIIVKENNLEMLYFDSKTRVLKYKARWKELVESYLIKENSSKFILKENMNSINKTKFINSRREKIKEWQEDDNCLLSDFFYIDDLIQSQKKIIYIDEAIYILLRDITKMETLNSWI